jgi:tyramine---L-glutamate ligase
LKSFGTIVFFPDKVKALLRKESRAADATLVIAPECDGILKKRCETVENAGGTLLGPSSKFVELTSDKQFLSEHFMQRNVPTPRGYHLPGGMKWRDVWNIISSERDKEFFRTEINFPLVIKPNDGCGSVGVQLLQSVDDLPADELGEQYLPTLFSSWRIEQFMPGRAVSVGFLCGIDKMVPLVPCAQRFATLPANVKSGELFFYRGGSLPIEPELAKRAIELGRQALIVTHGRRGYVGLDLVLGEAADGSQDHVIEVNPRITTSYLGLRRASKTNLAQAMLDVMDSKVPELPFHDERIEFSSTDINS